MEGYLIDAQPATIRNSEPEGTFNEVSFTHSTLQFDRASTFRDRRSSTVPSGKRKTTYMLLWKCVGVQQVSYNSASYA